MKEQKGGNNGILVLAICGILALALIIGCVFFPDQLFGIFM